jgi:hypothetical protein
LVPDHPGSLAVAILLYPLILWIPGMVLGGSTGVLGFRTRSAAVQVGLGLLLSMSVCPILVYLLARASGGFRPVWAVFGIVWLAAAVMAVRHRAALAAGVRELWSTGKTGLALAGIWIIFCSLWEIDFVTSGNVFRDLNTMDAIAHVGFTDAITRTGIPPANPFAYPGHPLPLFYYYGWYLISSLIDQLGGSFVTARAAVQGGTVYLGLGIAALVIAWSEILGARIFGGLLKLRTGLALALFAITGLDLIPWTFLYLLKRFFDLGSGAGASIEWWNEQVTAWVGAVLMSPHHPVAMVISFTAVLLFFGSMEPGVRRGQKILLALLMAVALASAAAVSAYVVLALGAGLAIWVLFAARRGWWKLLPPLVGAAVLAAILYAPFALELRAASHETSLPVTLTVRAFLPVDYWLPSLLRFLKHSPAAIYAMRFVFLPLNYFAELGFFMVATVLYWRWRKSQPRLLSAEESLLTCLAAGSVLVCTFLMSTFSWNDLGWRGFLIAQFVMVLWAAPVLEALLYRAPQVRMLPSPWRPLVWFCLVVGAAGTFTEIVNFRVNFEGPTGSQALADRDAYLWVDQHTNPSTVMLFNPSVHLEYFSSLYGHRQAVSGGEAYGSHFSSGPESERILDEATRFFNTGESPAEARSFCRRYGVGVVIVHAMDPVWKDRNSWVWTARPSYANSLTRIFLTDDIPDPSPKFQASASSQ